MDSISHPKFLFCAFCALCGSIGLSSAARGDAGDFLLVRRNLQIEPIRLNSINDRVLEYFSASKGYPSIPLSDCIALLNPSAARQKRTGGLLLLADGQRLPGEAVINAKPQPDTLAWNHPWLGRIDVPFKLVESVLLTPTAKAPQSGRGDVIAMINGDRTEGLVVSLGNPISVEVTRDGQSQIIDIPLQLVEAVTLIAQRSQPSGRRIWFEEGTVLDVQSIVVGDDGYVRLSGAALASGTQPTRVSLSQIEAILLAPRAMVPLATIAPARIEGPETRYTLPKPAVLDPDAPLGLSVLEFRGPLISRYALPEGSQRFSAEAELPRESRGWGDYELVIRSNDAEVFRAHLDAKTPSAMVNVPLSGSELSIELLPGAHGPIQDRLTLTRAMVLVTP